ncbi:MAG: reverse transcriptase-like protein [Lachnospiraceae bacterium]|nr:reverse transcriptase-like protein [Lachnospiraceae bacterium]
MAKKKVYAVKKGKTTGIFRTWEECRVSVEGYPGAEYKSFSTDSEAQAYLTEKASGESPDAGGRKLCMEKQAETAAQPSLSEAPRGDCLIAYVDGSFDVKLGRYSFGCVFLTPSGEIIREAGNGDNPQSAALRNVTGEMLGAMFAVKWCEANGYKALRIYYDYMGIEMWATGGWRAKNDLTQKYARFMSEHGKRLAISFQKVAAHTGNRYNEEADRLAKAALTDGKGIPPIRAQKNEEHRENPEASEPKNER